MAYTNGLRVNRGLTLDFTVQAADTDNDDFLGVNSDGEVTAFSSIPVSRLTAGGNLTEATSSVLTIVGGTGAVLDDLTIQVKLAGAGQGGYLSSADWTTFNNKLTGTLASANVFVGNGSNVATAVSITGDISITNAGVVSITTGAIVNADINASAAIAVSKIAALTASRAVATDGSGFLVPSAATATELGHLSGVSSGIQTQLDTKLTVSLSGVANGDIITFDGADWINTPVPGNTVPAGGAQYEIFRKASATNYDTEWHTLVVGDLTDLASTVTELNLLSGVTTTTTQFNFLNTLVGDVQSQLDNKQSKALTLNSIWVGSAANIAAQVSPGSAGDVLTIVGGVPTWTTPGAGGTVTSVAISGGTTGLSVTGSPVTTSGTITLTGTLIAANGGTGFASYAVGDLLQADSTTTLAKLAAVATGNVLISGGVTTVSSWGKVTSAHVDSTVLTTTTGWKVTGTTTLTGAVTVAQAGFDINFLNGNHLIGPTGATITASTRVDIRGTGTGTGLALRVATSTDVRRFSVADNGLFHFAPGVPSSQFNPQFTATANNQAAITFTGSLTFRGTNSDDLFYIRDTADFTTAGTGQTLRFRASTPTFTINHTTATVIGYDYNPTLAGSQVPTHIAARWVIGSHVFGHTTLGAVTTRIHVRGIGTTTGYSIYGENSSGAQTWGVQDNGHATFTGLNLITTAADYVTGGIKITNTADTAEQRLSFLWVAVSSTSGNSDLTGATLMPEDSVLTATIRGEGVAADGSAGISVIKVLSMRRDGSGAPVAIGAETSLHNVEDSGDTPTIVLSVNAGDLRVTYSSGGIAVYHWTIFADIAITKV